MTIRTSIELQRARRDLFDQFPREPSAQGAFEYQVSLAAEIRRTETERAASKSRDQKKHLHSVRRYGDALAMTFLSEYVTRQLHRHPRNPAHLSAQGKSFEFTLDSARKLAEGGLPALLVDVTNILRIGDIVGCIDSNTPVLLECKLGAPRQPRFEKRGRRGRQLARMESVQSFLNKGRGAVYGDSRWRETLVVTSAKKFNYDIVDELVLKALGHQPVTKLVERDEVFGAALSGEVPVDLKSTLRRWGLPSGSRVAFGSSLEVVENVWPDISPPILWKVSPSAQWALMEGEVSVIHGVHADAFVGLGNDQALVQSSIDTPNALDDGRGQFAWSYEVLVNGEVVTMSANILRDIVYMHETLASAGRRLLEISVKASVLVDEADRPS